MIWQQGTGLPSPVSSHEHTRPYPRQNPQAKRLEEAQLAGLNRTVLPIF